MKKVVLISLCFLFILSGCGATQEAKAVINQIESIGSVDLESGQLIAEIEQAYEELPDKDKQYISNYSTLREAREQYEALVTENKRVQENETKILDINKRLDTLTTSSVQNVNDLNEQVEEIQNVYETLDDDFKSQVSEYEKLNHYVALCVELSVRTLANKGYIAEANSLLSHYRTIFSEELDDATKLECLGELGKWSCVADAITKLKRTNNTGNSNLTGVSAYCDSEYQDGGNHILGNLNFVVYNIYGFSNNQTIYLTYDFTINLKNCTITDINGFTF